MTYSWVDHTAELELRIEAASEEDVFADALDAYRELVTGEAAEEAAYDLELAGSDRADLLARWLDELVYLADSRGFVPERVLELDVGPGSLRGTVAGREGDASSLVKAVTYHDLEFAFDGSRWHARVVLDV